METCQVTLAVRGDTSPGEVIAVVGSCEALGSWSHQKAVTLHPDGDDGSTWTTTITVPRGVESKYRYFKGFFLESKISPYAGRQPVMGIGDSASTNFSLTLSSQAGLKQ